jgi:hypothetical protein
MALSEAELRIVDEVQPRGAPVDVKTVVMPWIPLSEAKPPLGKMVLLAHADRFWSHEPFGCSKAIGYLTAAHCHAEYWCVPTGSNTYDAYTHWAPMPDDPVSGA